VFLAIILVTGLKNQENVLLAKTPVTLIMQHLSNAIALTKLPMIMEKHVIYVLMISQSGMERNVLLVLPIRLLIML
jgi:hypothetical protein